MEKLCTCDSFLIEWFFLIIESYEKILKRLPQPIDLLKKMPRKYFPGISLLQLKSGFSWFLHRRFIHQIGDECIIHQMRIGRVQQYRKILLHRRVLCERYALEFGAL